MTPSELNAAVAEHTGEDLALIQSRGFSPADPLEADFDPEPWLPDDPVDIEGKCLERLGNEKEAEKCRQRSQEIIRSLWDRRIEAEIRSQHWMWRKKGRI